MGSYSAPPPRPCCGSAHAGEGECLAATSALLAGSLLEHCYSPQALAAALADVAADGGEQQE